MNDKLIKPKVKNNITVQDLGDEVILYDSERENVHVLNHTAQIIWKLCNGNNSIEDIENHLLKEFSSINKNDLIDDIHKTINNFNEKKLLV
jgi:hypothetical protein